MQWLVNPRTKGLVLATVALLGLLVAFIAAQTVSDGVSFGSIGVGGLSGFALLGWAIFGLALAGLVLNVVASAKDAKGKFAPDKIAGHLWRAVALGLAVFGLWWIGDLFDVRRVPRRLELDPVKASQQSYAGRQRVSGTLAPRAIPATVVEAKGDSRWEVSIDGSNEVGYADPVPGHRTKITLRPGERVAMRHLGGIPAFNRFGERVALCGVHNVIRPGTEHRFPVQPHIFAIYVGVVYPDGRYDAVPWRCGIAEMVVRNDGRSDGELLLWFNLADVYRGLDDQIHRNGFSMAGWDGERARFEVNRL